jgi:hypothetical protein
VWREKKIGLIIKIVFISCYESWFNYVLIANYCLYKYMSGVFIYRCTRLYNYL